jgi:hypothetical protein
LIFYKVIYCNSAKCKLKKGRHLTSKKTDGKYTKNY